MKPMTEFVLWARLEGAESWDEKIIIVTMDKEQLEKAKIWAKENGFIGLRVLETFSGDKPDFHGTIKGNK